MRLYTENIITHLWGNIPVKCVGMLLVLMYSFIVCGYIPAKYEEMLAAKNLFLHKVWKHFHTLYSENILPHWVKEHSNKVWGNMLTVFVGMNWLNISMDQICSNVHVFQISVSQMEYKGARNPLVFNVLFGIVEEPGGSWLELAFREPVRYYLYCLSSKF